MLQIGENPFGGNPDTQRIYNELREYDETLGAIVIAISADIDAQIAVYMQLLGKIGEDIWRKLEKTLQSYDEIVSEIEKKISQDLDSKLALVIEDYNYATQTIGIDVTETAFKQGDRRKPVVIIAPGVGEPAPPPPPQPPPQPPLPGPKPQPEPEPPAEPPIIFPPPKPRPGPQPPGSPPPKPPPSPQPPGQDEPIFPPLPGPGEPGEPGVPGEPLPECPPGTYPTIDDLGRPVCEELEDKKCCPPPHNTQLCETPEKGALGWNYSTCAPVAKCQDIQYFAQVPYSLSSAYVSIYSQCGQYIMDSVLATHDDADFYLRAYEGGVSTWDFMKRYVFVELDKSGMLEPEF